MDISSCLAEALRRRVLRRVLIVVPVVVSSLWVPVRAQDKEPPNILTSVKALKCRFPAATTATWKNGEVQAQTKTQEMLFTISEIDVTDGTAEFLGTAGRSYVTAVLSGWSMYFVESSVGQLNVTTVFAQEASPKKLKAVHSRHGYLQMQVGRYISEPSVSQNYGECEIQ
jgi:hypothetical protein